MLGSLSYLKDTQRCSPLDRDISRPLHRGLLMSINTFMHRKLPPSVSPSSLLWQTAPTTSQSFTATVLFINLNGTSCIWTQIGILWNSRSWRGIPLSYHCSTTRCLSKLQGALLIIRSTFSFFSKVNSKTWSLIFPTSKPFTDLHRGLKVFVTASTLSARFVKNFAAIVKFLVESSSSNPSSSSSLAFRDKLCQCLVRFSMFKRPPTTLVSPKPREKKKKERKKGK